MKYLRALIQEQRAVIVVGFISGLMGTLIAVAALLGGLSIYIGTKGFDVQAAVERLEASQAPIVLNEQQEESAVIAAVDRANPAVVSIVVSKDVPILEKTYDTSPFDSFFGGGSTFHLGTPHIEQKGTEKKDIAGGSGFLISDDGYLVTNNHVISQENADYTVFLNDGKKYDAKIIASDPETDLALLKIEGTALPYLAFGDSESIQVGQTAIAIGNALGEFRNTVSVGVISGLSRSITAGDGFHFGEDLENVIQTDAAINPGNSGGPLLNLNGEVIGVNVAVANGSENIGFSLPSNAVKSVIDMMKTTGKVTHAYLGVRYREIDAALQEANNLAVDHGALVIRGENITDLAVVPGSPADKAGIEENDIILSVDGTDIDETHSLKSLTRSHRSGDVISLKILHDGSEKTISVTLEESPS